MHRKTLRFRPALCAFLPLLFFTAAQSCGLDDSVDDRGSRRDETLAGQVVASFEAETMTVTSGANVKVFSDPSASAGQGLVYYANGKATKQVTTTSAAGSLVVVAKGDQCSGAPQMVVLVDGNQVLSASVPATSWTEYAANVSIPAGTHTVEIDFTNDLYQSGVCDRNLRVDRVAFVVPTAPSSAQTIEEEDMTVKSGNVPVISDSAASGGKARKFWNAGATTKSFSTSSPISMVTVTARGDQCNGAPQLVVKIDGTQVLSAAVASTSYTDVSANVSVPSGAHTLEVDFTNDYYASGTCDRNLIVDKVTLSSTSTGASSSSSSTTSSASSSSSSTTSSASSSSTSSGSGGSSSTSSSSTTSSASSSSSSSGSGGSDAGWTNVVNDQFDSGGLPAHWFAYPYQSTNHSPAAYYSPSHVTVAGGSLHLLMRYETSGLDGHPGNAWYTGTVSLKGFSSADYRVTLRWRLVPTNGGRAHHNMPLTWPDDECWPLEGEEDWFEGESATYSSATAFMHYGTNCSGGGNTQLSHSYGTIDLTQWHTYRFQRVTSGTNVDAKTYIDDLANPVWTCNATTSPACTTTTMPATMKHFVLQQEVPFSGPPDNSGTDGTVDFEVDWITVDHHN